MDPLTKEERESFRQYAGASLEEPDGSECQWANHTLRLLDEADRLREDNARLKAEVMDEAHAHANEFYYRKAGIEDVMSMATRLKEARAEVARLEGLILDAEDGLDDYWRTLPEAESVLAEARRIRGEKPMMLHPETGIHFGREVDDLRNQLAALREKNARLRQDMCKWQEVADEQRAAEAKLALVVEALREIEEGAGPFDRDPLKHASNCVEAMRATARAALAAAKEK